MDPLESAREENLSLRRTLGDVLSLSTLPALWVGLSPEAIARSLAEVLLGMLSLDLAYVRLVGSTEEQAVEAWRSRHAPGSLDTARVQGSLAPLLEEERFEPSATIRDPVGDGTLQAVATRFGVANHGMLVTASRRTDFPTERDRALLSIGANQATIILQQRQAEDRVRQSEERFRRLMDQAPFSIQLFSPEGRTIDVNQAWEELWGVEAEQIGDYNILEDRQLEERGVLDHIKEGFAGKAVRIPAIQYDPNETIPDITKHDDPRRWLSAVIYPLEDSEGRVQEVVLIHEDITARKLAEEALRDSRERLDLALQASGLGHWELRLSDHATIRSERHDEIFGYESAVPEWTYETFLEHVVPEDREAVDRAFRNAVTREESWDFECRIRRVDGVVRWIWAKGRLIENDGAGERRMAGTVADVTERKQIEEELRDTRSRLEAALEAGTIVTWTWDIPNNRLFGDEALNRLFGLSEQGAEDGALDRYMESIHRDDQNRVSEVLSRSLESGEDYEADYRIVQNDGSVRWVVARGRAERDEEGRPIRMPGVLVDITDRKRLEEELRLRVQQLAEVDRRKDEFLATLAHELRNPLAPLRNSLQILKMRRVDEATLQKTTEMMERQVHHLVRLVDDLLDVSRVMRGKIELRKEPVELANVVARALETAQPLIEVQEHELEISVPSESLLLNADPVRMSQLLGNLLTNAAKYTETAGHIALSAERDHDEVVVRVRDSGIGIAPDMLPHVFDLFVQADHTTTRSQGGLGIGLTLVKNLVELHGGTIEAHSAGLGEGSEFVVRLPLAPRELREAEEIERPERPRELPSPGHRILVVDDNEDAAATLAMLLELQGHDVEVVHEGRSALERAHAFRPKLILLDLGMPGMDGYEVAHRIRQTPELENVVLAAVTGWGQEEDRRRTTEAGFDHHLVKPVEPTALATLLADLS